MTNIISTNNVKDVIIPLRGQDVILASDVAKLYGVETKVINQAVKNNPDKFPEGFVFELTKEEAERSRSKFLTLNESKGRGHNIKYLPKAFTERGLYMLATILKSPIATQTTLAQVETYYRRKKKNEDIGKIISIAKKMLERGYSEEEITEILK